MTRKPTKKTTVTPVVEAPIAMSATVPTYDERLKKVRMSMQVRHRLLRDIFTNLIATTRNTRAAEVEKEVVVAANQAIAQRMTLELATTPFRGAHMTDIQALPPAWFPSRQTLHIELQTPAKRNEYDSLNVRFPADIPLPAVYWHAFYVAPNDTNRARMDGNVLFSTAAYDALLKAKRKADALNEDMARAKERIEAAAVASRTIGVFFDTFPAVIELTSPSLLAELVRGIDPVNNQAVLPVAPKDLLCSVAKVRGLQLAGCE